MQDLIELEKGSPMEEFEYATTLEFIMMMYQLVVICVIACLMMTCLSQECRRKLRNERYAIDMNKKKHDTSISPEEQV
jgi:hypothetical protein